MDFLFIMDPAGTMLPDKDTSFAFMRAAQKRGHRCFHCLPRHVHNRGAEVFASCQAIRVSETAPFAKLETAEVKALAEVDAVFVRKDPPFDSNYLYLTQQLDMVQGQTLVVNNPTAIRKANEKLFAFQFAELMPPSLVSADPEQLLAYIDEVGGKAIIKPLDGAGGSGVIGLSAGDRNNRAIVDLLTDSGSRLALVQEFLPDVFQGDKRVLLLDGELLGAIRRIPRNDDIRANIHVGGSVQAVELTKKEQQLVDTVGPRLKAEGLYFVGLDLIGERLIEVNVTSPTGIQELGRLTETNPEDDVIAWTERRVQSRS